MWGRRRGVNLVDTPEMDAFFGKLDHLSQVQLLALRAAWNSTSLEVLDDAWTTVRAVGARDGLAKEIDRVRNKALSLISLGRNNVPFAVIDLPRQFRIEAGGAIIGAAVAVALGSRLDAATHDVLIGPWLRATEDQR